MSPFPVKEDRPWRLCTRICEKFRLTLERDPPVKWWTLYIRGAGWTGQDSGVGVINCHDFIHDFSSPEDPLQCDVIAWLMRGKNSERVVFIKWTRVSEVVVS